LGYLGHFVIEREHIKAEKSQQHLVFPGGLPSKYYPSPTLLNFGDLTRTGAFNVVWPLTMALRLHGLFYSACGWVVGKVVAANQGDVFIDRKKDSHHLGQRAPSVMWKKITYLFE
jgi:hypothetical protein